MFTQTVCASFAASTPTFSKLALSVLHKSSENSQLYRNLDSNCINALGSLHRKVRLLLKVHARAACALLVIKLYCTLLCACMYIFADNLTNPDSVKPGVLASGADERHGNPPQGNLELLVVRDKVGRPPGELGVSKSMECDIFPFSVLTLLVG